MANLGQLIEQKIQAHDFVEAMKLADQIPENHQGRYLTKIKCHMAEHHWDLVYTEADLGIEKVPAFKHAFCVMKAQAYSQEKKFNEAATNYGLAVDIMKDKADQGLLTNYANALKNSTPPDNENAIKYYKEALSKGDGTPQAIIAAGNLATLYITTHKDQEALELLKKAVLLPNQDKQQLAKQWANKGSCESNIGDTESAKKSFQEALKLDPNYEGLEQKLATIYYNEMIQAFNDHDAKKSLEAADQVLKLIPNDQDPRKIEAYYSKAVNKQILKEEGVIEAYEAVLRIDGNHPKALINLALEYQKKEDYEKAIQYYKQAAQKEESFILYSNLGEAYQKLKQPNLELALESFNHAIRINPNAVLALTNRANFYLKKKEKDKGMADLKTVQLLIQDPKNVADLAKNKLDYIQSSTHKILEMEAAFQKEQKALQEALAKQDQQDPEILRIQEELAKIQKEIDDQNEAELAVALQEQAQSKAPKISRDDVKKRIQELLNEANTQSEQNKKKIKEIKVEQKKEDDKIDRIEKKMTELEECMQIVGLDKVIKVKDNYAKWRLEYKEGYNYAKAFYWTFINYCDAQKIASTEIVNQESGNSVGSTTKVAVKVTQAVLDFGSSIPLFGAIFSAINSAIGVVYEEYEKFQDEYKRNAILEVIMKNQDADDKEGWSMLVATAAQLIAERKRVIFEAPRVVEKRSTLDSVLDWLDDKVKAIKNEASGQKVDLYESWGGEEACKDIVVLLAFILKNHKEMAENTSQTLDITIADIIYLPNGQISPQFQSMLNRVQQREEEEHPTKQVEKTDNACTCQLI